MVEAVDMTPGINKREYVVRRRRAINPASFLYVSESQNGFWLTDWENQAERYGWKEAQDIVLLLNSERPDGIVQFEVQEVEP